MDTGSEFKSQVWNRVVTSTEVGDCVAVCNGKIEALFECKYWASIGFEDYRIEDNEDNTVLGCDHWEENAIVMNHPCT